MVSDLAAGEVGFPHHAQQIALVADDGVIDGHTVQCASVQREAPEGVQRVAANDERGRVAHLRVLLLDVGQRLVGFVLGLELVVVHHLGAQRGVFLAELLVFFQNGVDVGVVLPQEATPLLTAAAARWNGATATLSSSCGAAVSRPFAPA